MGRVDAEINDRYFFSPNIIRTQLMTESQELADMHRRLPLWKTTQRDVLMFVKDGSRAFRRKFAITAARAS